MKKEISGIELKVLVLEDSTQDLELVREQLTEAGYLLHLTHVDKEEAFASALHSDVFDIILSDFKLPGFDAFGALQISNLVCPQTPFICVSGSIGEETAIELLKLGAIDYVLKDRPERLPFAVKRALDEASGKKLSEERVKLLNRAIESSSVSIFITDPEGNIIYSNPFFSEITGYTAAEIKGRKPSFLKSGHHGNEFYKDLWETVLAGRDWTGEFHNKKKNGELYWEKGVISPIVNDKGEVTNFVAIKEDITERKKMLEDLVASKEKAEESDRLKTAFLNNISHEIRTPMNAIIGFSALLSDPEEDEAAKTKYIETITQSSDQLLAIISDIIDISNIEAGIVKLSRDDIRINNALKSLADQFSIKAAEQKVVLRMVTPLSDENAVIISDSTKVKQILSNLLSNAFKFTSEGTIEFGYKPGKDYIEFYVSDSGIGIPPDQLLKIFDRFYQVDHKLSRLNVGTGLGLSISRAFVELLGGSIRAESEPGKGSVFYFTLPFEKPSVPGAHIAEVQQFHFFDRDYNILLVEDDETNAMLMKTFLHVPGLKIFRVSNGAEAVAYCRSGKSVDIILMDLKMPVLDGYEATRQIKAFMPDLPIIAQTAYAFTSDIEKAKASGCIDFISKPFRRDFLLSKIKEHLQMK